MCGLVFTNDYSKLEELIKLNSGRGNGRYSSSTVEVVDGKLQVRVLTSDNEYANIMPVNVDKAFYLIHQQAQTSNHNEFHPAKNCDVRVWHNGMLKSQEVERLGPCKFDTEIIARIGTDWNRLSDIEGTFACIMTTDTELFVFRNQLSPLWFAQNGEHFYFSSVKMSAEYGVVSQIASDCVHKYNFETNSFEIVEHFSTKNSPYKL